MIDSTKNTAAGNNQIYVINSETISRFLCLAAIGLLGINFLMYSFFQLEYSRLILRLAAGVFFVLSILIKEEISLWEAVLVLVGAYMMANNGNLSQNISYVLLAAIAIPYHSENLWKKLNKMQLIFLAIVLAALVTGAVQVKITTFSGRIRNTLGFNNANIAAIFIFSIIAVWVLQLNKIRWYHLLICMALMYYIYQLTKSRTPVLTMLIFCISYFVFQKWNSRGLCWLICGIELGLFILPQFVDLILSAAPGLDRLLSNRLSEYSTYINSHGMLQLLFGGSKVDNIDNFYLCLLYNGGVFFYLLTMFLSIRATWIYMNQNKASYAAFILSLLFLGVMESGIIRCEILCMIMFWYLLIRPLKAEYGGYVGDN